jgi:hypothetical protein
VINFADNADLTLIEEYLEFFGSPIDWNPIFESIWPPQSSKDLAIIERIPRWTRPSRRRKRRKSSL